MMWFFTAVGVVTVSIAALALAAFVGAVAWGLGKAWWQLVRLRAIMRRCGHDPGGRSIMDWARSVWRAAGRGDLGWRDYRIPSDPFKPVRRWR